MTDEPLLGITALFLVAVVFFIYGIRHPALRNVVYAAFALRAAAALFHAFAAPLPDGTFDAVTFENVAADWAQLPFSFSFPRDHSYFISWIISLFYRNLGRSPLMAQAISVFFGTGAVVLGCNLAGELWGPRNARRIGWILVFFPTLVLYSALTMREAYIWFFFLLGIIGVVRWGRYGGVLSLLLAFSGFLAASAFHGGIIIGAFTFVALLALHAIKRLFAGLMQGRFRFFSLAVCVLIVVLFVTIVTTSVRLPKIGSFQSLAQVDRVVARLKHYTSGSAAFPEWTRMDSPQDIFLKMPVRVAYFLFSPFFWDIRSMSHILGYVDGIFYMGIVFLLWKRRKIVFAERSTRLALLVIGSVIIAFSMGVGNFGASVRHRAKVVSPLLAISAPFVLRPVFQRQRTCQRIPLRCDENFLSSTSGSAYR